MSKKRREREPSDFATAPAVSRVTVPSLSSLQPLNFSLTQVEDRRTFHPDPVRPAATFSTGPARLTVKDRKRANGRFQGIFNRSQTNAAVALANPHAVPVCVRRKTRKQVLFAHRKTGKGGTRRLRRPRRRSAYSAYSC